MRDVVFDHVRSTISTCTDRAVRYVHDMAVEGNYSHGLSQSVRSRSMSDLLDLNDDNPVGWSFYFLKQIINSINP